MGRDLTFHFPAQTLWCLYVSETFYWRNGVHSFKDISSGSFFKWSFFCFQCMTHNTPPLSSTVLPSKCPRTIRPFSVVLTDEVKPLTWWPLPLSLAFLPENHTFLVCFQNSEMVVFLSQEILVHSLSTEEIIFKNKLMQNPLGAWVRWGDKGNLAAARGPEFPLGKIWELWSVETRLADLGLHPPNNCLWCGVEETSRAGPVGGWIHIFEMSFLKTT